jgi:PAS domain S-box-containing protein
MRKRWLRGVRPSGSSAELAVAAAAVASDGLALIGVEAGPRFRYLEANDVLVRMSGFSRGELLGHWMDELLVPDEVVDRARLWSEVARSGTPVTYVLPVTLSVGRRVFETTVSPVADPSGATTRLVQVSRDVTDREQASETAVAAALQASETETAVAAALQASETETAVALQASETETAAAVALQASETAATVALQASETETETETAAALQASETETAVAAALQASKTAGPPAGP